MSIETSERDLVRYYAARAQEYEAIYRKPERQDDLQKIEELLRKDLVVRHLLEVACGTGYWTARVAEVATSVLAMDINHEVIEVARRKALPASRVQFGIADCYKLPDFETRFDAALAAFWWSHVPKSKLADFLVHLAGKLTDGARVVFFDNNYVEGSSTPISQTDPEGNTYQLRTLRDGRQTTVLKNFPTTQELRRFIVPIAAQLRIEQLQYYWYTSFDLAPQNQKH